MSAGLREALDAVLTALRWEQVRNPALFWADSTIDALIAEADAALTAAPQEPHKHRWVEGERITPTHSYWCCEACGEPGPHDELDKNPLQVPRQVETLRVGGPKVADYFAKQNPPQETRWPSRDELAKALEWAMAPNERYEGRHRLEPRCREFMPTDADCSCGYKEARRVLEAAVREGVERA